MVAMGSLRPGSRLFGCADSRNLRGGCCAREILTAWSLALLQADDITAADVTTSLHGGVYPDIDVVVLGCRAEDPRILGQVRLRQRCHHAPGAGTGYSQLHLIPDVHRVA